MYIYTHICIYIHVYIYIYIHIQQKVHDHRVHTFSVLICCPPPPSLHSLSFSPFLSHKHAHRATAAGSPTP